MILFYHLFYFTDFIKFFLFYFTNIILDYFHKIYLVKIKNKSKSLGRNLH